jgi:AcrR family transcriptional regulator
MKPGPSYKSPDALNSGRSNQKARTRQALVAAARDLVLEGKLPTVIEAAQAAQISTATAYRYFPDQLRLLGEALKDAGPFMRSRVPGDIDQSEPATQRITIAAEGFFRQAMEREKLIRAVMALSLLHTIDGSMPREEAIAVRPGLRRIWIEKALATEARLLPAAKFRRLKLALNVLISSEALTALKDMCGISGEEAMEVCSWASRTLVTAVLQGENAVLAAMAPTVEPPKGMAAAKPKAPRPKARA